jgi:hypothetical protein
VKKIEEAEAFEKLESQIQSTRHEIAELSKKKPNDPLNKFKQSHLNALLTKCNTLLGSDVPLEDFTTFDEEQLATNSDAIFVLAHYTDALHRFRVANTGYGNGKHFWILTAVKELISAPNPARQKYED